MSLIRNILVATDFSEGASRAERRSGLLAAIHQCQSPELIHINEAQKQQTRSRIKDSVFDAIMQGTAEAARQELELRATELRNKYGIEPTCTFRFGQASKEIISRANEIDADLILTGGHESNALPDFFFGSTVDQLIRLSSRPLLIVKNEPVRAYLRVLVLIDFSEDSKEAARTALAMAPSASFTFLHACEVEHEGKMHFAGVEQTIIDDYRLKEYEHARTALQNLIEELHAPGQLITQHLVYDKPSAAARKYAEQVNPDLIVVGKYGRSRIEELLIGSVTRDTIAWTKCDILVVPPRTSQRHAPLAI